MNFHAIFMQFQLVVGYIEQEVSYVFIELPALHPDVVIPSQLVSSVHTSHVFVVGDHSCRAAKGLP